MLVVRPAPTVDATNPKLAAFHSLGGGAGFAGLSPVGSRTQALCAGSAGSQNPGLRVGAAVPADSFFSFLFSFFFIVCSHIRRSESRAR